MIRQKYINEDKVTAWKRWVHKYSAVARKTRKLTNKERPTKRRKMY